MKRDGNSGDVWLGDVPEHWEVKRLSPLSTKITNGYVGPTRDILTADGVRYLQSLHIKENEIRFIELSTHNLQQIHRKCIQIFYSQTYLPGIPIAFFNVI